MGRETIRVRHQNWRKHMIYILAIILSLIFSAQSFALEITAGNITHLKNGRQPNAGAAMFPVIPIYQLLAIGAAWLLQISIPKYSLWILTGCYLALTIFWGISLLRLKAEFNRILKS